MVDPDRTMLFDDVLRRLIMDCQQCKKNGTTNCIGTGAGSGCFESLSIEMHKIEICETLCRVVEVKAEHAHDALISIRQQYVDGKIVLDSNDIQGVVIELL